VTYLNDSKLFTPNLPDAQISTTIFCRIAKIGTGAATCGHMIAHIETICSKMVPKMELVIRDSIIFAKDKPGRG
jgi:hypothetical protein